MNLLLSVEESTVCVRAEKRESARRMRITTKYIEFQLSLAQKCPQRNGAEGASGYYGRAGARLWGGGAQPKRVDRKKIFETSRHNVRIDALRLVPVALTRIFHR